MLLRGDRRGEAAGPARGGSGDSEAADGTGLGSRSRGRGEAAPRGERDLQEGVSLPGPALRAPPAGSGVLPWPQPAVVASVAVAAARIHGSDHPAFPVVPAGAGGSLEAAWTWPSPAVGGRASRPFLNCFLKLRSSPSAAFSSLSLPAITLRPKEIPPSRNNLGVCLTLNTL